ncbi:MAG: hypothetical protein IJ597_06430 [Synergistaceae bacterium]|nr:hypothetical protein [Synergistaceae bacterium]
MKSKIFLFSFLALLVFSTAALADDNITTEYELVVPSSNTNMDYTQGAYNLIGDLKVKVSGEGSFKPTATV